ncbi:MAG: hypothetical protein A2284_09545 [Deltaproteobacteria bacterium RIFOXYA12_FULL_61_11]|nr:MAG: hypothetical protein A2284_09545 [Deltaproteobacteria bacterium RIFOXYA12_FULL_61_11]
MRIEATIPDNRATALVQLAAELQLSRSQLIDEALALFVKAVLEVRRGRRLVMLDPSTLQPTCELATPTLAALEWAQRPVNLELPDSAIEDMKKLMNTAPAPNTRLREAAKRTRQ